jgi:hypothetical protein
MIQISTDPIYIPLVCQELALPPTPSMQCIVCGDSRGLIAGALYEDYNTVSVSAHVWVAEGRVPSRAWYAAICDYPFNRLGVRKVVGRVVSENKNAMRLDEHLGFVHEATITDFSPFGDLKIYTITREQCKILNSPLWQKHVSRAAAC